MRKHAQSWLIKGALFVVAIVFVFWGVGSFRSEKASRLAQVDGETITVSEYQTAYRKTIQQIKSMYGDRLDDKTLYSPEYKRKVLEDLIEKKIVMRTGKQLGFQPTSEELSRTIQQMPGFQENGKFSTYRYKKILEMNRIAPQEFEAEQSENLLLQKTQSYLGEFVKVDPEEVRQFYSFISDERNCWLVSFKPEDYQAKVSLETSQLKTFFNQNQSRYRTPVQTRVAYLEFNPREFEARIALSDKEVQEYYFQNQKKFQDPQKNQPIPFEQVKEKIQAGLKEEKAKDAARIKAEELYDQILIKGNLVAYGREAKIPLKETPWLTFGQSGSGLEGLKEFTDKAFVLKKGDLGPVLDLGPNEGFVIQQVLERKEAQPMTYEQAEARLKKDYLEEKGRALAQSEAEALVKDLKGRREPLKKIQEKQLKTQETGFYSRFKNIPSWATDPEAQKALFAVGPSNLVSEKPFKVGSDWGVLVFKEYQAAPLEGLEKDKERFTQALIQQKRSALFQEWSRRLREKAKIRINQDLM